MNGNCAGTGGVYRVDRADDLNWLATFMPSPRLILIAQRTAGEEFFLRLFFFSLAIHACASYGHTWRLNKFQSMSAGLAA